MPSKALVPPVVAGLLSIAGPVIFMTMQTAGIVEVTAIKREQSVGNRNPLPFVSLFTNCVIWSTYGLMTGDPTVYLPNITGFMFGAYYTMVYITYAERRTLVFVMCGVSAVILTTAAVIATVLETSVSVPTLGYIGCTLAVILMASPLAAAVTVIKTKNSATMPFLATFTTFCNALCWALYGAVVAVDPIVAGPNLLGLLATLIQFTLIIIYPPVQGEDLLPVYEPLMDRRKTNTFASGQVLLEPFMQNAPTPVGMNSVSAEGVVDASTVRKRTLSTGGSV